MMKIIFATGNQGKFREVKEIFHDLYLQLLSLNDFDDVPGIIEDGSTFEENALIKAKIIFEKYQIPTIADDSGLEIEQLGGHPGIRSARYAGEDCTYDDNNNKVLYELEKFPQPHKAKFICSAVYFDSQKTINAVGKLNGQIIETKRGSNGFGYDPIFLPDGFNQTLAEISIEEKNKISHRYKAFIQLKQYLEEAVKL